MRLVKKALKIAGISVGLLAVAAILGFIVYLVVLSAQWSNCKKAMAQSFSYAQKDGVLSVTYEGRKTYIINDDQDRILNELTTGMPVKSQRSLDGSDEMVFEFGDGTCLTAVRQGKRQIQFYYVGRETEYGFLLSEEASFDNLLAFVQRNR